MSMIETGRVKVAALVLGVTLTGTGCNIVGPTICTTEARPAIVVEVLDSVSGEPVRGSVRVVARSGSTVIEADTDDMNVPPGVDRETFEFGPFVLGHERAGTYEVTVEAPGYVLWQQTGVRVEQGECHVETAEVTARLQPE